MGFERVWHKSYPKGTPNEVEFEKITMPEVLDRTARDYPDKVGFIYMGKKITFAQLNSMVNRFAKALMDLGIKKGDKVGMILPNIPQVVIANLATQRIGGVTAMNNPLYTERELAHQLNDSDAKAVVTLDLLLPRLEKIKGKTKVKNIITCHINDFLPFPVKQLFPYVKKDMYRKITPGPNLYQFMDLLKKYKDDPVPNQSEWDGEAALLYTGGTTGVSKGAVITHSNLSAVAQIFKAWFPEISYGDAERLMGIYPIFHSAGYSVSQNFIIYNAWTGIMVPRPEPGVIIDMIKKFNPTFLPGVPTIFMGLLANEEFRKLDLSGVKGYFGGAAPLSEATLNELKKLHGAVINDVFGATENTAFGTCTPWKGKVKLGTVGVPLPNTDIKIVDMVTGENEMPPGEPGEICIKGPQVMKGYYNRPEETAKALKDGWFHMGDVGVMDEEGYLSIVDRKKDMIIASGYNIYPAEIDEILLLHPEIAEACTIGIPDEYRGETVKAWVVCNPGVELSEEQVMSYCKEKLAAYKVPKSVKFVDELPKSAIGKLMRREVRRMELEGANVVMPEAPEAARPDAESA
ncbi:long-chain acyl-CoA synthetase [Desulfatibacillum alkenivorans DSM 16219]|jgi:long-chain acyl-CoA synthetase|uniref:Long-chain acyl-CoA synthetase n=1 Tax=Desulfatibacillum alkenivorans DSM 16219 TaxID=1121393 RepID=A0A1M6IAI8_9BACT|nr:long-chain fatty acid--CoA ligase [Desulfatibacillum alkenivorans]SHJ31446.1 long-chain acyl-CoA synthetase [Desulfatibacillum alkenivorans DSM 16219]